MGNMRRDLVLVLVWMKDQLTVECTLDKSSESYFVNLLLMFLSCFVPSLLVLGQLDCFPALIFGLVMTSFDILIYHTQSISTLQLGCLSTLHSYPLDSQPTFSALTRAIICYFFCVFYLVILGFSVITFAPGWEISSHTESDLEPFSLL